MIHVCMYVGKKYIRPDEKAQKKKFIDFLVTSNNFNEVNRYKKIHEK